MAGMQSLDAKRAAARAALAHLPEAGVIGLGSGTTASLFIEEVAKLVKQGRRLVGVPTSENSRSLATRLGIELLDDAGPWTIEVTVDGADEVTQELDLIKGGGGCHTREKIVNQASRTNIIVVDQSKLSERLGERWPIPVEVLKFGHQATKQELERLGQATLRTQQGHPFVTDAGNYIYDVKLSPLDHPSDTDQQLKAIPGVVETGLFCRRASRAIVSGPDGLFEIVRPS